MFTIENDEDHQLAISLLMQLMDLECVKDDNAIHTIIDNLAESIQYYEQRVYGALFNDKP